MRKEDLSKQVCSNCGHSEEWHNDPAMFNNTACTHFQYIGKMPDCECERFES